MRRTQLSNRLRNILRRNRPKNVFSGNIFTIVVERLRWPQVFFPVRCSSGRTAAEPISRLRTALDSTNAATKSILEGPGFATQARHWAQWQIIIINISSWSKCGGAPGESWSSWWKLCRDGHGHKRRSSRWERSAHMSMPDRCQGVCLEQRRGHTHTVFVHIPRRDQLCSSVGPQRVQQVARTLWHEQGWCITSHTLHRLAQDNADPMSQKRNTETRRTARRNTVHKLCTWQQCNEHITDNATDLAHRHGQRLGPHFAVYVGEERSAE